MIIRWNLHRFQFVPCASSCLLRPLSALPHPLKSLAAHFFDRVLRDLPGSCQTVFFWHMPSKGGGGPLFEWLRSFLSRHTQREPRRPLFVSVVLYLNEAWADDLHSETLVLDPVMQVGLFVRPAPGRMLIMVGVATPHWLWRRWQIRPLWAPCEEEPSSLYGRGTQNFFSTTCFFGR